MVKNNSLLKIFVKVLFFIAMIIVVNVLSKIYSHFVTYTEPTDFLSQTYIQRIVHEPVFSWTLENEKEGIELDPFTQKLIEDAYRSAWYLMNKSIHTKIDMGMEDHLSKKMIARILKNLENENSHVDERVELNHNIDLHLFSYDRQLVSFSDNYVQTHRKLTSDDGTIVRSIDTSHFDVVMGLEDGYWKLLELKQVELPSLTIQKNKIVETAEIFNFDFQAKAINYYPSKTPWFDFWTLYNQDTVLSDLKTTKEIGFNSVRIFIPYFIFGKAYPQEEMLKKLDSCIMALEEHQLKGIITLFDFPESFYMDHYPATGQHIRKIMRRYKENKNIWAWDLKNEADLDFGSYGEETVLAWLRYIIDIAREEAPHHLLTVGWSSADVAHHLSDELDLVSFHSYKTIEKEEKGIQALKSKIEAKPMFISEFGKSSYRSAILPFGSTENEQAVYTQDMLKLMEDEDVEHYAFWTLYDFEKAPSEVFGWKPWIRKSQAQMGVLTKDGEAKSVLRSFKPSKREVFKMTFQDHIKPFYIWCWLLFLLFLGFLALRTLR